MPDRENPIRLDYKTLTITSLVFGFFLIPVHEFGHVLCDWIAGYPASMSYARDYLLSGGRTPFLGLLGGPLLPLLISAIAVIQIARRANVSVFLPVAILGAIDRLVLYAFGMLPSDERDLAEAIGWNPYSFKYVFLSLELVLLLAVVIALMKYKVGAKAAAAIFIIPLVSFFVGAAFGVFVIERFLFPVQYKIQFGG
ncbi:MAG: hypothetical protein ACHQPI_08950 [Thermoanaerobaculia bacterium]